MKEVLDAFWRAGLYCLHPRVIALSLLPLVLMLALSWGLAYFFWQPALDMVAERLQGGDGVGLLLTWLEGWGLVRIRAVLAPALLLVMCIPVIVSGCLLLVAWLMTPAVVRLVADRRFATLQMKQGASFFQGLIWSLGSVILALILTLLSLPLWLIPPLALLIPALIWGWLTYRVLAFDALAAHASVVERREILRECRLPLLCMGLVTGMLGVAPALLWASGALFVVMAPLLVPVAIWLYTLTFAFSALWFAHFCLAALESVRARPSLVESVQ
jgi:hypothetical protein